MTTTPFNSTALRLFLTVWVGLTGATARAASGELLDFQIDPFGNPPKVQFEFSTHVPMLKKDETNGGRATLVIECPDTTHDAAPVHREFPDSYPMREITVREVSGASGQSLFIRVTPSVGWTTKIVRASDSRYASVTFLRVDEAGVNATSIESSPTAPTEYLPTRQATAKDDPVQNPFIRGLQAAGGMIVIFGTLALCVYGGMRLWEMMKRRRQRKLRPEPVSRTQMSRLFEESEELMERFQSQSSQQMRRATERQQAFMQAVQGDMKRIREGLHDIVTEFERATNLVAVSPEEPLEASEPRPVSRRPTRDYAPQDDETGVEAARSEGTDRMPLNEWVARVSNRLREDDEPTVASPLSGLDRYDAPPQRAFAPSTADRDAPDSDDYAQARQMLRAGRPPIEVARATGVSLAEIELLSQIDRLNDDETQ